MGLSRLSNRQTLAAFLPIILGLAWLPAHAQGLRPSGGAAPSSASTPLNRAAARQGLADFVVAVVNSEPVTNNEVAERALRLGQQMVLQGEARPSQAQLLQLALDMLINEKLQLQLAEKAGIKIEESAIRDAELNVAGQNRIPLDEVLKRLELDGISREQFRATLRSQLTLSRLREREVEARVKVSENEVEQRLLELQNPVSLLDAELNIGQVLVAVPEGTAPSQLADLQARAQRILERARSGEDFSALAREFSDASEASSGGQLGLRPAERYPELFVEALKGQAVGAVVGPIRSNAGFHVLKLLERVSPSDLPSSVTQSRGRHILLRPSPQLSEAQALERLQTYRKSIEAGTAEFVALARQHSQDTSAREGGDLGWVNPGQFVAEFEDVMNSLAPGQISAPFRSRFGLHLVQLMERREVPLGERERRSIVRNQVRQKKMEEAHGLWMQEIRANAFVQLREPPQ